MMKMLKSSFAAIAEWFTGSQKKRDAEEIKSLLKEIRQNQKIHIAVQRKMNERIMAIEYQLDAKKRNV